ncbi:hypothetical protein Acr_28g0007870 [Actinidia rufa]|uniref:Uncharacterized protein n=1 Tax=Actinidia rufa TaxID=165716 RepID=A0A7J0HAD9_9ERIC|nr:hypothetical protein Acr_28g0007870 [Actinidia rufa]
MANPTQAPDLEGLHREIHDMAEQMRIMNENNGRLMQLLAAANPPLPAAPLIPDVEQSRHSNRSGNHSRNISADQVGRRRRQKPSSSREKSSSESSKTPTRSGRGRSPRRGDHIRARDKSTSQKIRDLDARLDAYSTLEQVPPVTVDTLIKQTEPPFTERILRARISSKFKLPTQLSIYEGKTDPMDHLDSYKSLMSLQGCSDESKADKYIAAEELAEAKRRRRGKDDHKRKEPDTRRADYREETRYKRPDRDPKRSSQRRPRTPPRRPEFILPPLNAPVAQISCSSRHSRENKNWAGQAAPFSYPPDRIWRKYDAPFGMDQFTDNPGRRASPDHRMAGFYCGRLPLSLQCHPGATNFRRNQGDHLDLSPEAEVSHTNRDWRDKGRSESGQAMLHLGHEGRNLISSDHPIAITEHGR